MLRSTVLAVLAASGTARATLHGRAMPEPEPVQEYESPPPPSMPALLNVLTNCPRSFEPVEADLEADRAACTADCAAAGYCCTTNTGGCGQMTCSAGCHLAWHSADLNACFAACQEAAGCEYTHEPSNDINSHVNFQNCFGHEACGCPREGDTGYDADNVWGVSNDCSGGGCARGCQLAASTYGHAFYGRALTPDELAFRQSADGARLVELQAALVSLHAHVSGTAVLDGAELAAVAAQFKQHEKLLRRNSSLVASALDLVDTFEASADHGPLFISRGPFLRGET